MSGPLDLGPGPQSLSGGSEEELCRLFAHLAEETAHHRGKLGMRAISHCKVHLCVLEKESTSRLELLNFCVVYLVLCVIVQHVFPVLFLCLV